MLLLIDDNELVRNSLEGLLIDLYPGLEVRSFARCEPALLVPFNHVDFVLLDFNLIGSKSRLNEAGELAELDGWACLQAMIARFPQAKVVLMSATQREQMAARAQALGAHGFVEKSVQAHVLLGDLKRALDA
jgi:DNA-binding NarL/FixJ family response regulator